MGTIKPSRGIAVFSGGTAANSLVDVFSDISQKQQCPLSYIIPISDNGGSSSELIRVFGGPGIGDIRSRLIRLIPPTHAPILNLLNHRLPPDPISALSEWTSIVSNLSPLWTPIPTPQRELLRSTLLHLHQEMLKRARPPQNTFNFASASIGNLFLTGARLFTGSFESAIYLLSIMGGVSEGVKVLPVVNSMFTHHISAGLEDGTSIVGQNAISHPSAPTALDSPPSPNTLPQDDDPATEDANLPGTHPDLRRPNITFSKSPLSHEDLPCRINRIWYINPYGQEIRPAANPKVCEAIRNAEVVIYSIGSLYTSIIPCLVLKGVGEAIVSTRDLRHKILILNGSLDRETGPPSYPFTASDFVSAIARAGEESRSVTAGRSTALSMNPSTTYKSYITHIIHLDPSSPSPSPFSTPTVNRQELASWGIECVRVYGRTDEKDGTMRYDGRALEQALEAVLGSGRGRAGKSRRNTVDGGDGKM